MPYQFVKVFGERNSGTNFLNKLIEDNVDIVLLKHKPIPHINEAVAKLPVGLKAIARERLIDLQRQEEFDQTYGWKHACVDIDVLKRSPLFTKTLFIFIVRNPFAFLNSLYQHPHNAVYKGWKDKTEFLQTPWLCNLRDRVTYPLLRNPVLLWNLKNKSFLQAQQFMPERSIMIRYEDVVLSPDSFGTRLSKHVNLKHDKLHVPMGQVKKRSKNYSEYFYKVKHYDPSNDFLNWDLAFIHRNLDSELLRKLYPECA